MFIQAQQTFEEIFDSLEKEIRRGALDKKHPFRFVTLATQAKEQIGLRYVVLRKVTKPFELMVYTDARTEKCKHIAERPQLSFLFYHPGQKLQVRIDGAATLHHDDDVANAEWKNVQGIGQRAYSPQRAPGSTISTPEEAHDWPDEIDGKHFAVIVCHPRTIEALQLNQLAHLRVRFSLANDVWKGQWTAP